MTDSSFARQELIRRLADQLNQVVHQRALPSLTEDPVLPESRLLIMVCPPRAFDTGEPGVFFHWVNQLSDEPEDGGALVVSIPNAYSRREAAGLLSVVDRLVKNKGHELWAGTADSTEG